MSQEIINTAMQNILFSPMTCDKLWSQFLEAISYEISNMRDEYELKKNNWCIYKNDKDNIIRISKSFGYEPNLVLDNTIFLTKRETESIPYRIKNKTTYDGYNIILKQNDLNGDVFNYYYNGYKLIKGVDYEKTKEYLNNSNHYSPFLGITPIMNFSTILRLDKIILDYLDESGNPVYDYPESKTNRWFYLDQKIDSVYWCLDLAYNKQPSDHIGIEYYPEHYYSHYIMSLGLGEENKHIYEIDVPPTCIPDLMEIQIEHLPLSTTNTEQDSKIYFQDENGILNPNDSYYDIVLNKIHLNFNEIPVGQEISINYKINKIISKDYFVHLEHGMEYNRACTTIPHCGIFLTAEISQNVGSDYFYNNPEGYTVPDLKLKAITASVFNRNILSSDSSYLDYAKNEFGEPSGFENYKLDNTIKWYLDSKKTEKTSIANQIKYISCGNKKLNPINNSNTNLFNLNNLLINYNLNTDDDSTLIKDSSLNLIDCTVVGETAKINGIIDKSLNFDGETYAYSTSTLSTSSDDDYTFGMWFNCNKEPTTPTECLFDGFITIEYDYENEKLIIDSTNEFDCAKNTDYFLTLIFNHNSGITSLYLNSELIDDFNYSISSTSFPIYIGTDSSQTNNFYGIIDSLWLVSKQFTKQNIDYIYDNKISVISHIGNIISRYELYPDEINEDDNYLLVQSYVKAMDVNNEWTKFKENGSNYYTYKTKFAPISSSYFTLSFTDNLEKVINLKSNNNGQFYNVETNEIVTGNINYETGELSLAKNTIKSKSQEKIQSPTETNYNSIWDVIIEQPYSNKLYTVYESSTDTFSHELLINEETSEINYDDAILDSSLFIYTDNNDSEPKSKIFTTDESSYYVTSDGNPNRTQIPLKSFIIGIDDSNTALFSSDNGKSLYHTIKNMILQENQLNAFIDLGEQSNTILYSTDNGTTMYLDVKCQNLIKKYQNGTQIGYTLNSGTVIYSNLSFNNIISNSLIDWHEISFIPMQQIIKSNEVNLSLTLMETRNKYLDLKTIDYITETDMVVGSYRELLPNSITLNYWIEDEDGKLIKYTATINENGEVSGENIESGIFNYDSDQLNITYIKPIKSDIIISYSYNHNLELNINKPIIMNYKLNKPINVNEIGLENENHELIAYMTFPDVEFNSINDNASAMFAIIKK